MTTTSRRGRPESVTKEAVASTAADLLRSEGYEALSMRRIGRELGVDAMVPYRHFGSKDGLLDAVFEKVVGEAEPEPTGQPVEDVRLAFEKFWRDLVAHPGLLPVLTPRMLATEAAMSPFEWVMDKLVEAGLDRRSSLRWYTTLLAFVLGSASIHPGVQGRLDRVELWALDERWYPTISGMLPVDYEQIFEDSLNSLIDQLKNELEG